MKKYRLKMFAMTLLAFFCLFSTNTAAAYATAVPDLGQLGSICVVMRDPETGRTVSGGSMTLHPVGSVKEENGNFSFALESEFEKSGEQLKTLDAALALRLATYAKENGIIGTELVIDGNGKAEFTDVEPGLYLLVQEQAAQGYYTVNPFLVSIPLLENGVYIYDVDATPKMELLSKKPLPTPTPTPIPTPTPVPDIPVPTPPWSRIFPRTGDNGRPMLWLAVMAISAFGTAGALAAVRKKQGRE